MKITQILRQKSPTFSFEFFPPKSDEDVSHLMGTARALAPLSPGYISVTWGAGGSTRRKTLDIVSAIKQDLGIETMSHLTCVGADRLEIERILEEIKTRGIENVLALRGDPPKGETVFRAPENGFRYANELVQFIRSQHSFCLGVAGYPEGHIETRDLTLDMENLKRKIDAGADFIVTQLFFDNEDFYRFRDRATAAGIRVPFIPGIMPITNVNQVKRFTQLCGAKIPYTLLARLESIQDDTEAVTRLGIEHAIAQGQGLLAHHVPGIHFYTLNRSRSTVEIVENLTLPN